MEDYHISLWKSGLQLPPTLATPLVVGLSMSAFSTASAETSSAEGAIDRRPWGLTVDELGYQYSDSNDALLVWDSDFHYGVDVWRFHWLLESEWDPKANVFEAVENRIVAETPISESLYISSGIRLDTSAGPNRTFAVLGIGGEALENLDLELNFYIGEGSEALVELDAEYELVITPHIALTGNLEALFAASEDVKFGIGTGVNSTEAKLRLSYSGLGDVFSPYISVSYEREYGDTADFTRVEGDDIDVWIAVIGIRMAF